MIEDLLRRQLQLDKTSDSDETAKRILELLCDEVGMDSIACYLSEQAEQRGWPEGARVLEIAASNLPESES